MRSGIPDHEYSFSLEEVTQKGLGCGGHQKGPRAYGRCVAYGMTATVDNAARDRPRRRRVENTRGPFDLRDQRQNTSFIR
jgi:hypothetical protein